MIFNDATPDQIIGGVEIDTVNNKVYFTEGDIFSGHSLKSVGYSGGAVTDYGPISFAFDPFFGFTGGVFDFTLDVAHDTAYFTYVLVDALFSDPPSAPINYIVKVNSLANPGAGYSIVTIVGSDDPDGPGGNPDNHFPELEGSLAGVDIDIANQTLYFVTQRLGGDGTGGIFKLDLTTGIYTEIWEQPSNNAFNTLQPFPTTQMQYIEVDTIGGRYYVTTLNSTDTAIGHDGTATDEGGSRIFSGSLTATPGTAPTVFASVFENTANGAALGMEIDYAPILTLSSGAGYTEGGPPGDVATGLVVTDPDQAVIKGATVAITAGFTAGDTLSFTPSGGIVGSYDAATGVLTLTGNASFAAYQTVLDLVAFSAAGDNPTNYGANPTRTVSFTVTDGLLNSDPATATVAVTAVNDAPVNTVPGAQVTNEDTALPISGVQVSDVDANPATANVTVTLSVLHGAVTLRTDVAGGITAGQVTGNGSASASVTATINQINATLAAMNGLVYVPTADYTGPDTLQVVTNDGGNTGTGGAQSDTDTVSITINAVADIANDAATTNEDTAANVFVLANDSFEGMPAITGFSQGANGSVALNDNGTAGNTADDYLVYTPNADFNGADSFSYTVTSGGVTETATVNVTVDPVADIVDDSVTVGEDSGANTLDLLANDNFENAGRSITAVTQGVNGGTVAINNNGTPLDTTDDYVTYTPAPNYNGPDSFTYTVTSGGVTETATVTVNVTASNDDPVNITGGAVAATEDASVAVTGLQVSDMDSPNLSVTLSVGRGTLAVDTGVPGGVTAGQVSGNNSASVTISGTQAQINATLAAMNGLVYTPTANLNGPDTLTMATSDGSGGSDTDMVSIGVAAVNDAPTVAGDGTEDAAPIAEDTPSADRPDRFEPVRRPIFGRHRPGRGRLLGRSLRRRRGHRQRLEPGDRPVAIFQRRDLGEYRPGLERGRGAARGEHLDPLQPGARLHRRGADAHRASRRRLRGRDRQRHRGGSVGDRRNHALQHRHRRAQRAGDPVQRRPDRRHRHARRQRGRRQRQRGRHRGRAGSRQQLVHLYPAQQCRRTVRDGQRRQRDRRRRPAARL